MPTPYMAPLFTTALELIDYDADNQKKLLRIIESYIMLDPHGILQPANVSLLFTKLAPIILRCKADDAPDIAHTLDLVIQSVPLQVYGEALLQSGLLTNILNILLQNQVYTYLMQSLV
jgi:hypothetical protein